MSATRDIEFGVMLSSTSNNYGLSDDELPAVFRDMGMAIEDHGFDVLVAGDHIAYPEEIPTDYEFSKSGEPPFGHTTSVYNVFQVLAQIGALTDDLRLGTNVCAVPYRHPIDLTKQVLSLDSLTGGRFDFGVAPGWLKTEFDALDVPFEERGSRTDEFLALFNRAREEGELSFDGRHHSFDTVGFHPEPAGDIPIWVGGYSGATFRRIAEFADGWTTLWDTPEEVVAARKRIMNAWTDYDRDGEPEIAVLRPVNVQPGESTDRVLTGDPDDIIEDVQAYIDAGATRLIVDFFTTDIDAQKEQLEYMGEEIIPSFS